MKHTGPLSSSISQVPLREHAADDFIPEATKTVPGSFLTKLQALKTPQHLAAKVASAKKEAGGGA